MRSYDGFIETYVFGYYRLSWLRYLQEKKKKQKLKYYYMKDDEIEFYDEGFELSEYDYE